VGRHAKAFAHLDLYSTTLDPDQISEWMGREPTDSWRKGDVMPKTGHIRETSRWELQTSDYFTRDLNEPLEELLEMLRPVADPLRTLVLEHCEKASICLVGSFAEANPGLYLAKDLIATIADLGLDLDVDLYFIEPEE
jgi:hypothetical protein